MNHRSDGWLNEDDLILAETVLRHIREGSTQTKAFQEVADKLNRTDAACAFRWNANLRQRYESALNIAKKQRLLQKKSQIRGEEEVVSIVKEKPKKSYAPKKEVAKRETKKTEMPKAAEKQETDINAIRALKVISDYIRENEQNGSSAMEKLKMENKMLKEKVEKLEKDIREMEEEYKTFSDIVNKARDLMVTNGLLGSRLSNHMNDLQSGYRQSRNA